VTVEGIVVTVIASLLSGLVGVGVSAWFFYRLERQKQKLDLARGDRQLSGLTAGKPTLKVRLPKAATGW
jgi:hypothetical protein